MNIIHQQSPKSLKPKQFFFSDNFESNFPLTYRNQSTRGNFTSPTYKIRTIMSHRENYRKESANNEINKKFEKQQCKTQKNFFQKNIQDEFELKLKKFYKISLRSAQHQTKPNQNSDTKSGRYSAIPYKIQKAIQSQNIQVQKKDHTQIKISANNFFKQLKQTEEPQKTFIMSTIRNKTNKLKQCNQEKEKNINNQDSQLNFILNNKCDIQTNQYQNEEDRIYFSQFYQYYQKLNQRVEINFQNKYEIPFNLVRDQICFNKKSKQINQRILLLLGINYLKENQMINHQTYIQMMKIQNIQNQNTYDQITFLHQFFTLNDDITYNLKQFKLILKMITQQLLEINQLEDQHYNHFISIFEEKQLIFDKQLDMKKFNKIFQEDQNLLKVFINLIIEN